MKLMTPHEKVTLIALLEKMPTTTPCTACRNYDAGSCRACEMVIPKEVVPQGCESWQFDKGSIPF